MTVEKMIIQLEDSLGELKRTTAVLGFIQTAFAEGNGCNMEEAGDSLELLYLKQSEALDSIHDILAKANDMKEVA